MMSFSQSFTVAIIVPDADILGKYARENNISGDMLELCKKKVRFILLFVVSIIFWDAQEIKELIFNDIKQLEKSNLLKGFEMVCLILFFLIKKNVHLFFEQVKDIYIHPEPFTVENNLLTPTMKTKRPELGKYFEKQIEEMYKHID